MSDLQTTNAIQKLQTWAIANPSPALIIKIILGAIIIALSSQISIDIKPVPITGQTLGVTIVGLSMGRLAGTLSVVTYLIAGALGLPVFAGGTGGFAKFFGASGGFLYGFLPMAFILGYFSDKGCLQSWWKTLLATLIAQVVLFAFGLIQLSIVLNFGLSKTLSAGLYPFIPGGIIKSILAVIILNPSYKFFSKIKF